MADLTTRWLGFTLKSPFIVSACPISKDPDLVARAVRAGASAVVMYSLFEEQLTADQMAAHRFLDVLADSDAESRTFLPNVDVFSLDAEPYMRELETLRARVDVPIIASLNGATPGGWTRYAKRLEAAGASAIELNLYEVATSAEEDGAALEQRQIAVVSSVVSAVSVPVNVKISAFYSSVPAFVRKLENAGAKGVAVFNRFYQPDVDIDELDVDRHLVTSTSAELPLRLHALAILSPITRLSLACTGGVHTGRDAAKALVSGAHVIALASVLLQHGPEHLVVLRDELCEWLDRKGYRAAADARGVLDASSSPDPHAWERLNYVRMLEGWHLPSKERE